MIKYNDKKISAKCLAQELIMDNLSITRGYWFEGLRVNTEEMTEKEIAEIDRQLKILGDRIAKVCNFTHSWKS